MSTSHEAAWSKRFPNGGTVYASPAVPSQNTREQIANYYRTLWGYAEHNEQTWQAADRALEAVAPELERLRAEGSENIRRIGVALAQVGHERDVAQGLLRGMARRIGEWRRTSAGHYAEFHQAVEDWGRNDEQMLAENQRLADEVARLTEIIRKSDAVDKHNLQAELKQRNLRYGIASATIGRLRGDLARVREERDHHIEHGSSFAAEAERLRGELRLASDRRERETAQIRGELRIEEDNVAFAEKTLHLVLQCCDGEQDSCSALEAVYGYVRLGEKPPVADAVVLPSYEDVVDAVRVAVGRKGDERDEEAVAAVLDYLRSCGVSSENGDRADV